MYLLKGPLQAIKYRDKFQHEYTWHKSLTPAQIVCAVYLTVLARKSGFTGFSRQRSPKQTLNVKYCGSEVFEKTHSLFILTSFKSIFCQYIKKTSLAWPADPTGLIAVWMWKWAIILLACKSNVYRLTPEEVQQNNCWAINLCMDERHWGFYGFNR